jgi:hypothetical protein
MKPIAHVITGVVIALCFTLLWRLSSFEKAKDEPGRKLFPPTQAFRWLMIFAGIFFSVLAIAAFFLARKPDEWWVPYLFLGSLLLVVLAYPPLLTIEVDGIESCNWRGTVKKIRWEEIASLHYNSGNNQFTVRDKQGRKISHAGFNVDPEKFRAEIQKKTRLPLQFAEPGIWGVKTTEIPYFDEDEATHDNGTIEDDQDTED